MPWIMDDGEKILFFNAHNFRMLHFLYLNYIIYVIQSFMYVLSEGNLNPIYLENNYFSLSAA